MSMWTEEHDMIRKTVREFVNKEINPYVDEWEREGIFPAHELFKKAGDLGLLGLSRSSATMPIVLRKPDLTSSSRTALTIGRRSMSVSMRSPDTNRASANPRAAPSVSPPSAPIEPATGPKTHPPRNAWA